MSETTFTMSTTDSEYSYTARTSGGGAVINRWKLGNNNKTSDTQGYLRKVEKGDTRVECLVSLTDTKDNLETNVIPMLTYPTNVNVTFPRTILSKSTNTGTFAFEDLEITEEFPDEGNGEEMEIQIKLVEVIS